MRLKRGSVRGMVGRPRVVHKRRRRVARRSGQQRMVVRRAIVRRAERGGESLVQLQGVLQLKLLLLHALLLLLQLGEEGKHRLEIDGGSRGRRTGSRRRGLRLGKRASEGLLHEQHGQHVIRGGRRLLRHKELE